MMFGVRKDKRIEEMLRTLEMDASNNYKDAAQKDLHKVEEAIHSGIESGQFKGRQKEYYEKILHEKQEQLREFTHKDQLKNVVRR